jgi:hypothetical protein
MGGRPSIAGFIIELSSRKGPTSQFNRFSSIENIYQDPLVR